MNSSRFPGKPMKEINGIPMIGHCLNRAKLCKSLDDVYVATCDEIIFDYIKCIKRPKCFPKFILAYLP